jgi:signal transduction histidine kinase
MFSKDKASNGLWIAGLGLFWGIIIGWGIKDRSKQRQTVLLDIAERSEIQRWLIQRREMERLHLAQQLHDGPVQDLYGLSYHLVDLGEALPDEARLVRLTTIRAMAQQVIRVLQTICSDLWPPTLLPFGLETAIRSHAERFQEKHPELKIRLDLMTDEQMLPALVRAVLFRIYQQLLDNVIRHAQARLVLVQFTLYTEEVVLQVQDNGRGFEVPQRWMELVRQKHLGLLRSLERAKALGGRLKIISAPGKGTIIQVIVPRPNE